MRTRPSCRRTASLRRNARRLLEKTRPELLYFARGGKAARRDYPREELERVRQQADRAGAKIGRGEADEAIRARKATAANEARRGGSISMNLSRARARPSEGQKSTLDGARLRRKSRARKRTRRPRLLMPRGVVRSNRLYARDSSSSYSRECALM